MSVASAQTFNLMRERAAKSETGRKTLLLALRESAVLAKDDAAGRAILERIELDAGDNDSRWKLAHEHAEGDGADLSLLHYLRIPFEERSSGTWNNLGVAYDTFSMPAKAVLAFSEAVDRGEMLVSTNLAGKLISVGFLQEAQDRCDKARKADPPPQNLARMMDRLAEVPDEEVERETEVLEKARGKSEFLAGFGQALAEVSPATIADSWAGPDCRLRVTLKGDEFVADGSYEQPTNALLGYALSGIAVPLGGSPPKSERVKVEYKGNLRGRGIEARVSRRADSRNAAVDTILGSALAASKTMMSISGDEAEIKVMELASNGDATFYTLTRGPTPPALSH